MHLIGNAKCIYFYALPEFYNEVSSGTKNCLFVEYLMKNLK